MLKLSVFKRLTALLTAGILLISAPMVVSADLSDKISPSETVLNLQDEKIPVTVYKIAENDYVPLTGIINYFGFKAEFDDGRVLLQYDETVDRNEEFYNFLDDGEHTVIDSTHIMQFNGNDFHVQDLKLVDGYNFVPVSELDDFFGYELLYDKLPKTVVMSRDYYYKLEDTALDGYSRFIKENAIDFSLDDMEPLKEIGFDEYTVFLVGENHGISRNADIQLGFIKFLHENYGVRYIITELGYCDTIVENKFLETGDKTLMQERIEGVKGTYGYTKETYDFYMKLYEYNQTLTENERIVLCGIDVQHQWKKGLEVMNQFWEDGKEMPAPVKSAYEIITREELTHEELRTVLDSIAKDEVVFKEYLGENYRDFYFGLRSIWQSMVFYDRDDFSVREQFIHDNIRNLYMELEMDKCFGMFGGAHTTLDGMMSENKNMAHFLNTEFEPAKNKVLSIMCLYENSYYMQRGTGSSFPVEPNFGKTLNRMLAGAVEGELGLCATGQIPFEEGLLSDMFQYMLCVKNSSASKPYGA